MSKKAKKAPAPAWYDVRAESDDTTEVYIYDRIGAGWFDEGVGAKEFAADMAKITTPNVSLRINSPGGSVFDGVAIFNAIDRHTAHVTTHIDGVAASIASVIALAGDEVIMSEGSLFMVHNPWGAAMGEAKDMRKTADTLDKIRGTLLNTYRDRSWLTEAEVSDAMDAETWYTADEAQAAGFVDTVDGDAPALAATFDMSEFSNYPKTAGRPPSGETEGETTVGSTTTEAPTVDLSNLATSEDLTALESRIAAMATPPTPPHTMSVREVFAAQMTASRAGRKMLDVQAALADTVSTGNAGVLPPDWSSEVRDYVDRQRYAFGMIGSIGFPTSGYTLTIPKVLQHTLVEARGTEKTEISSQAFTTGSDTFSAAWYAGGVDIALELIWQSDPAVYPLIVDSILSQYAIVTDAALTLAVETAGTPTGAAIDFTDWGTVSAALIANAEVIRAATGEWGDRVMLTTASWQALIGLMDADGRRMFAPNGPTNADGSAALLSRAINVGGIYCSHNPRSAEDVQTNTKSARVAEKPPVMLQSDNVALMGRDLGVLGATMFVPAYPAGILTYAAA